MGAFQTFKDVADVVGRNASRVGLDVGGFATGVLGPALQTAGHAVVVGTCRVAGMGEEADRQAERMRHAASHVAGGLARVRGSEEPWFRGCPGQPGPWMSKVQDARPLAAMFLPGTHDSAAMHGGDFAECQCWTIEQQLEAGIRCFDIRLRHVGDELCCHHGIIYQERQMGSVAAAFESFLERCPMEVILARISSDGCFQEGSHSRTFEEEVRLRFRQPDRWVSPQAWPLLGKVRGKVVLFSGAMGSKSGIDQQNKWELGDHTEKFREVAAHAQKERVPGVLYVNWLSSQGRDALGYITPSGVAYHVNKSFHEDLDSVLPSVYMMDYPGADLIQRLIDHN